MVGARRAALEGSATLPRLACFVLFCAFACLMTPAAEPYPHRHLSQIKSTNLIDSSAAGDVHDNLCSTSLRLTASGTYEMGTKARGVPSFLNADFLMWEAVSVAARCQCTAQRRCTSIIVTDGHVHRVCFTLCPSRRNSTASVTCYCGSRLSYTLSRRLRGPAGPDACHSTLSTDEPERCL